MNTKNTTPQAELLQSQTIAGNETESKQPSSELIHREKLGNSEIIEIVGTQTNTPQEEWFAALGKYKITPAFKTKQELIKHTETWQFKTDLFIAIFQTLTEYDRMVESKIKEIMELAHQKEEPNNTEENN